MRNVMEMNKQGRRQFLRTALAGMAGATLGGAPLTRALAAPAQATPTLPTGLTPGLMKKALAAFQQHGPLISQRRIMAIADFTAASATPRFHILNLEDGHNQPLLVAHGKGSDPGHSGWVQQFSNVPGSEATSSGAYVTGESYFGQHGFSRRLNGLDPENDQAEARAIVIHAAWYVSQDMALEKGKIGRSQGCFAFSDSDIGNVMWRLPPGSMIYAGKA
jgi:L,D-transpeptidase catalytic domain